MDQIYNIRYLKKNEGLNYNQIVKTTGHDFETVKKYADKEDFNMEVRPKQVRKSKLDPYVLKVREWLAEDLKALINKYIQLKGFTIDLIVNMAYLSLQY